MTCSKQTRRDFLYASAGLAVLPVTSLAQSAPHLEFPTDPRLRLSVTSYPFREYIESPTNRDRDKSKPGMDLKEFAAMVAKRFGVQNINPLGVHLASTGPASLESFRKALEDEKSHLVDLGLGGRDFSSLSKDVREEAVAYGRKWIDIAAILGSPSVRQHLSADKNATPSVENGAESLGRLANYGAKKNVVVNLENDAPGAEDPFYIVDVVRKVDSPYLRALPDFGNSIRGHDAAYNRKAVDAMFKYAYNMSHVKDVLVEDGQTYRVDLSQMFQVARANSYRGYFSMEYDSGSGDPFTGTEHLVKESLKYMA